MKNFILILFFLPICLFSQSWKDGKSSWKETKKTTNNSKITKCDCARAMMVSLMVSGFKDEDDLSSIEKNQMDKIESTYNNVCEKYMNDFISEKEGLFFKESFFDCIYQDKESSDFCKCNQAVSFIMLEAFIQAFANIGSQSEFDDYSEKREKTMEKFSFCEEILDLEEGWNMEDDPPWDEKKADKCEKELLERVLKK